MPIVGIFPSNILYLLYRYRGKFLWKSSIQQINVPNRLNSVLQVVDIQFCLRISDHVMFSQRAVFNCCPIHVHMYAKLITKGKFPQAACKRTQHSWPKTPNIVGCYTLGPFAHPVAFCWMLLCFVAQSLKPVKLLAPCKRAQHCWPTSPTLLDVTWCVRLHTLLHFVGCFCLLSHKVWNLSNF